MPDTASFAATDSKAADFAELQKLIADIKQNILTGSDSDIIIVAKTLNDKATAYSATYGVDQDVQNLYSGYLEFLAQNKEATEKIAQIPELVEIAINNYKKILDTNPAEPFALDMLAQLLKQKNDYKAIKEIYEKAIAVNPNDYSSFFQLGWAKMQMEDFSGALTNLTEAEKLAPANAAVIYQAGICLNKLGDNKQAESYFKKAIALEPCNASFYQQLETLYAATKPLADIVELYREAASNCSNNAEMLFQFAYVLDQGGNHKEAIENYEKILSLNTHPEPWKVFNNIAAAYRKLDDIDKAIAYYRGAIALDPQSILPQKNLGELLSATERFQELKTIFIEIVAKQTTPLATAFFWLGYAQLELLEVADAVVNYDKAFELDKTFKAALYNKAVALEKLNENEKTIECYKKLITDFPDYEDGFVTYHYYLSDKKKFSEAITILEAGLKTSGKTARLLYELGNGYLNSLRYEKALKCYDEALQVDSKYAFAQHNKAWIFEKLGDFKIARQEWQKTIVLYEDIRRRNKQDFTSAFYYAEILFYSLHNRNYKQIEELYKEALRIDDRNTTLYLSLVRFYNQRKQEVASSNRKQDESFLSQSEAHIKMLEYSRIGIELVKKRIEKTGTKYDYCELAEFYLVLNKYDEAIVCFKKSLEKDDNFERGYNGYGVALVKIEEYADAIKNFIRSLDIDPDDLNVQTNLGDAYRKAGKFQKAEETFRSIRNISPHYIDMLVGLGECYKTQGDKAVDDKDLNRAEEFFSNALEAFKEALDPDNDDASKVLNRTERTAILYSVGYTKVRLFELKGGFDLFLLQSAKRDFESIPSSQPEYFKAQKAIKKINQRIYSSFSPKKGGPVIIFLFALLIFAGIQYIFFFNRYKQIDAFALNKNELAAFIKTNKLDSLQLKIEAISNESFSAMGELEKKMATVIPATYLTDNFKSVAVKNNPVIRENISEVAYGLFTFGSLLFMVVGLFLRDITRLKVGTIEMDKNAVDNVNTTQSLGVTS